MASLVRTVPGAVRNVSRRRGVKLLAGLPGLFVPPPPQKRCPAPFTWPQLWHERPSISTPQIPSTSDRALPRRRGGRLG
jgi:hypothetical protein